MHGPMVCPPSICGRAGGHGAKRAFAHPSVTGLALSIPFSSSVRRGLSSVRGRRERPPPDGVRRGKGRPIYVSVVAMPLDGQRSDLIRRPGVGTSLRGRLVSMPARKLWISPYAIAALNGFPSASMRCMITASLRASATLALLMPARLAIRVAQPFKAEQPLSGFVKIT